jgi:hypothetical protein
MDPPSAGGDCAETVELRRPPADVFDRALKE